MKQLSELVKKLNCRAVFNDAEYPLGIDGIYINEVCNNSEKAAENTVFICIKGAKSDGHDYYLSAYRNGCRIFICEKELPSHPGMIQLITPDTRIALALTSAAFFDYPEKEIKVIGITGTKGKSTVAYMLSHILNVSGHTAGTIGTCGTVINGMTAPTANTTPESIELFKSLRKMKDAGCEYAVIEVSSQAIMLNRIYGIRFFAAAMTNLYPDHIGKGEHPDFDNYKECKKRLFSRCDYAVMNADDKYYNEFLSASNAAVSNYSINETSNVFTADGSLHTKFEYDGIRFDVPLPGRFTVMNALCAVKLAGICGINAKTCAEALKDVSVPGRFEEVKTEIDARFIIDYAHNGESLREALSALRQTSPSRLVCLFGSVGGRTQIRRVELAEAAKYADFCIITSDNPDFEPPENIINDIVSNIGETPYIAIPDRERAVKYAVETAKKGDVILFAGKGHEKYQLINGEKLTFCESDLIKKYANSLVKA